MPCGQLLVPLPSYPLHESLVPHFLLSLELLNLITNFFFDIFLMENFFLLFHGFSLSRTFVCLDIILDAKKDFLFLSQNHVGLAVDELVVLVLDLLALKF